MQTKEVWWSPSKLQPRAEFSGLPTLGNRPLFGPPKKSDIRAARISEPIRGHAPHANTYPTRNRLRTPRSKPGPFATHSLLHDVLRRAYQPTSSILVNEAL